MLLTDPRRLIFLKKSDSHWSFASLMWKKCIRLIKVQSGCWVLPSEALSPQTRTIYQASYSFVLTWILGKHCTLINSWNRNSSLAYQHGLRQLLVPKWIVEISFIWFAGGSIEGKNETVSLSVCKTVVQISQFDGWGIVLISLFLNWGKFGGQKDHSRECSSNPFASLAVFITDSLHFIDVRQTSCHCVWQDILPESCWHRLHSGCVQFFFLGNISILSDFAPLQS